MSIVKPEGQVCVAIDVLRRFMVSKGYSLYDGSVFKKVAESEFTSVYCSTVKEFLFRSLANGEIANVLASCISQVTNLLSHPSCRIIRPLKIDF